MHFSMNNNEIMRYFLFSHKKATLPLGEDGSLIGVAQSPLMMEDWL